MKKLLVFILSLIYVSLIYQGSWFILIPLFGAVLIPLGLLICYHKLIYIDNLIGNLMSVLSTLFATFIGILANYFGAVYKTGDLNNIFHPDADYLMYIKFFTLINLGGAFILGLLFLFIKMFQRKRKIRLN